MNFTNMATTSTYAAQQSAYLDSLINYILDIKPYHTKLAASGSISEGYLFTDNVNVSLVETDNIEILLGADLMPATGVPGQGGYRARISQSWWHDILSDGSRTTWPVPQITLPLLSSSATLQNFTCGIDDYPGFSGIILGAFDSKRFDGPGITNVQKNGVHQQDTIDYTLSHGSYAVEILAGGNWKELDIDSVNAFSAQSGALLYNTVIRSGGTITNIVGGNYEEWTITCTYVDYSSNNFPAQASVVGSMSGNIGTAIFGETFTNEKISFLWTFAPGETEETAVGPGNTAGAAVSVWTLTPFSKITVAATAPQEVWSIIKSNPIVLGGPVLFNNAALSAGMPTIEIHTRSLNYVSSEQTWSLEFNGDGTYTLSCPQLSGYPVNVSLINGCAYRDDNIAFTLIPTVSGWNTGDTFTWNIAPTNTGSNGMSPANFKVYGSVSGWQADAKLGEWYWNGIIGFKIPALDYFTGNQTINFTALQNVHSMAEPSTYTITFATATNGTTPGLATVYNNIYGYRAGMVQGEPWSDEFCSFQIDSPGDLTQYAVGDQLFIYLSPPATYAMSAGYEVQPYEDVPFDSGSINVTVPYLYDSELFPLFQNYGALVWHLSSGTGTSCVVGDSIIIDKAFFDKVKFQITGAGTTHPELGIKTVGDVTDWLPLEFRYYDSGVIASDGSITPAPPATSAQEGYEPGRADFSDLATYIEAYSAANPNQRVFWITSPRFEKTDRAAQSTLTFDPTFFATYLPFNTKYSIKVQPDESYGQTIRTKITENLQVYARIYLELAEGPMNDYWLYLYDFNTMTFNLVNQTTPPLLYNFVTSISDTMHAMEIIDKVTYADIFNATIVEGGALPVPPGYADFPYDIDPYDQGFTTGVIPEVIETSPGVFQYTGNPLDFVIPLATTTPAIQIGMQPQVPVVPGVPYYEAVMADNPVMFVPGTGTSGSPTDIIRNMQGSVSGGSILVGQPGIASGQTSIEFTSSVEAFSFLNPLYGNANDFTLEMWFNSTSTLGINSDGDIGPGALLMSDISGFGLPDFALGVNGNMVPLFTVGIPGDTTIGASNPNSYNDGHWHYVVATRSASTGAMNLYIDGALTASGTAGTGTLTANNYIWTGQNAQGFSGFVSNLAVYNKVLAPSEISAHYAAGNLPQVTGGTENDTSASAITEGLSIVVNAQETTATQASVEFIGINQPQRPMPAGGGTGNGSQVAECYFSTIQANAVIVTVITDNPGGEPNRVVSSVTAPGLTFQRFGGVQTTSNEIMNLEVWWAPVSGPITNSTVTVNYDNPIDSSAFCIFGVIGFNRFDPSGSLPFTAIWENGIPLTSTFSTSSPNALVIYAGGLESYTAVNNPNNPNNPTMPNNFTNIFHAGNYSGARQDVVDIGYLESSTSLSGYTLTSPIPAGVNALMFGFAILGSSTAFTTVMTANEVFDFNLLEPTTWTGNPPETEGLLISTVATDYNITAINLPFDPTLHFPQFFVESSSNLGTYGTPSANFIYPPEAAGATSASYTFTLPGGFTAPFRLWIK